METLYFILGALSVVALFAVVSVFKIKGELKKFTIDESSRMHDLLGRSVDELENNLCRKIEELERELDKKEHELIKYNDELHTKHDVDLNELYRYIDSRNDKMADGIAKNIAKINQHLNEHDFKIGSSGAFNLKQTSTK